GSMGGDNGFLSLVGVPEVKSIADLKGKTVSVDALTTGYAFVLLDLLKRAGLNQADYKVEKAGGVLARWEAASGTRGPRLTLARRADEVIGWSCLGPLLGGKRTSCGHAAMSANDLGCVKTQKIHKCRESFFSDQAKAKTLTNYRT